MNDFLAELFMNQHYDKDNFFLIAGPCVVESEELVFNVAKEVADICKRRDIPLILKASYKKANRTSSTSFIGLGDEFGLSILQKAGKAFNLPVTTDIHSEKEALSTAQYVDVLQIPAFLCRQTELLISAANTGKILSILFSILFN